MALRAVKLVAVDLDLTDLKVPFLVLFWHESEKTQFTVLDGHHSNTSPQNIWIQQAVS